MDLLENSMRLAHQMQYIILFKEDTFEDASNKNYMKQKWDEIRVKQNGKRTYFER